jgi:hypothetical protein
MVCVLAFTLDTTAGLPAVVHEGAVLLDDHPLVSGREDLFVPLTLILTGDRDLPPTEATVHVTGEAGAGYRRYLRLAVTDDTPPGLRG